MVRTESGLRKKKMGGWLQKVAVLRVTAILRQQGQVIFYRSFLSAQETERGDLRDAF